MKKISWPIKKISWIIAAFTALLSFSSAFAETLTVGLDCTYPPFNYRDSSGQMKGFDVDIANEIAKRLGMEARYLCQSWDGLIPGLLAHKYDVIIAAMDITPERQKRIDFSIPYYLAASRFVGPKSMAYAPVDSDGKLSAHALKGKVVGVLRASIYEKYLAATYKGVELARYDTIDNMLLDLKAGRIDLAFSDGVKLEYDFLNNPKNRDFIFIGSKVDKFKDLGLGSGVGILKGNDALRERINSALSAMFADGAYERINRKYWSFSVKPSQSGGL